MPKVEVAFCQKFDQFMLAYVCYQTEAQILNNSEALTRLAGLFAWSAQYIWGPMLGSCNND